MDTLINDIRYAFRSLARNPGFAAMAVLTLALGIGANTTIFSVFYGVLLRPLPYPEPDRLVGAANVWQGTRGETALTYREYRFIADNATVFEAIAAATSVGMNLYTGSEAERLSVARVSTDYFRVLGVQPELGRSFTGDEDRENGPKAVVLSHALWQSRFAGSRDVVGKAVLLDGEPYTVVGVVPPFVDRLYDARAWTTLAQVGRTIGSGENLQLIARLKRGMTIDEARARLAPTWAAYRAAFAGHLSKDVTQDIQRIQEQLVSDLETPLRVLLGAIVLVLFIACANVANLTLGRAAARTREIAVRTAIGATRGRVIRQLITESVLLAFLGGTAGVLLALWGLEAIRSIGPDTVPWDAVKLDGWALGFTFLIALVAGVLFGLAPALQMARSDVQAGLREGSARNTGGSGRARMRQGLVIGEMAISLVLLAGAGLLIQTFARLIRTNTGFDVDHVAAAEIWLTGTRYDSTVKIANFYRDLTDRIERLPGVRAAAVIEAGLPLTRGGNIAVKVDTAYPHEQINYRTVTAGFFETLGIPLKDGRFIDGRDQDGAELVAVVNESFAKRFLKTGALDHIVVVGGLTQPPRRIVGVVGDVSSQVTGRIFPEVFIPSPQTAAGLTQGFSSWYPIEVVVRTTGDPSGVAGQLRRVIHETDPQVPVGDTRTMSDVLSGSLVLQRFLMALLLTFAMLAVCLAAIGLYGVTSSLVSQRTQEIGVRMALGARAQDVLRLVLGQGMALCGIGVVIGIGAALALTRFLTNQLYGLSPLDPATFATVTVALALVGLAASLAPAVRAARVDPMVALRQE